MRRVFSIVAAATTLMLTGAAPRESGNFGAPPSPPCSRWQASSTQFKGFLAANPELRQRELGEQEELFVARGRREWLHIYSLATTMGLASVSTDDLAEVFSEEEDGAETANALKLSADSPLPLIRRSFEAMAQQRAGDTALALATAHYVIKQGTARWGAENPGLIAAYTVAAQIRAENGEAQEAATYADAGLKAIAAHPERAPALAAYRITLLQLRAQISGAPAEAGAVQAMLAERRRNLLTFGTPYFDAAALIPGMQPAIELAQSQDDTVLGMPAQLTTFPTMVAATLPSPGRTGNLGGSGGAPMDVIASCLATAGDAIAGGDFTVSASARAAMIGAVNERSMRTLLNAMTSPDDSEGLQASFEQLTLGPESAALIGAAYADGQLNVLVDRLNDALTPGILTEAVSRLYLDPLKQEGKEDEEAQALYKKRVAAFRRYGPDLLRAVDYLKTGIAVLVGPATDKDAQKMREAGAWLAGPGAVSIKSFLRESEIEIDYSDPDEYLDGSGAKLIERWLPTVFESLGWATAQARADERSKLLMEQQIFSTFQRQLREAEPQKAQQLAGDFTALLQHVGPPTARTAAAARVIRATLPTIKGFDRLVASTGESLGIEVEEGDALPLAELILAYLAAPSQDKAQQWRDINEIAAPGVSWLIKSQAGEGSEGEGRAQIMMAASRLLTPYVHALNATGRTAEAARIFDALLPTREQFDELRASGDDGELLGDGSFAALALPYDLLESAIDSYIATRRNTEAFTLAAIQARRFMLLSSGPPGFAPLGKLYRTPPREPFSRVIEIAAALQPGQTGWDDVIMALDASKQSESGDTILLRTAAYANGPDAIAAYEEMRASQAAMENDVSAVIPTGLKPENADTLSTNADHLRDARVNFAESLPSGVARQLLEPASFDAVKKSLEPGEVILAPMVLRDGRIAVFALEAGGEPRIAVSPVSYPSLRADLDALQQSFTLDGGSLPSELPDDARSQRVFEALIGPVAGQVAGARHILWSPDPLLAAVPLPALRSPQPFATDRGATPYLGLAKAISFAPRLSALALMRGATAEEKAAGMMAVGVSDAPGLRRLPLAPAAAMNFASSAPWQLVDGKASIMGLKGVGKARPSALMFYAHGEAGNLTQPPALMLMPDARDPGGRLTPAEILGLDIRPDLVLLAACNTGQATGQGLQPFGGLVRGFLALGARAVLTSPRPVDPEAAMGIVLSLKQRLATGSAPAEALRQALWDASLRNPNPKLWGQFIWVGDGG